MSDDPMKTKNPNIHAVPDDAQSSPTRSRTWDIAITAIISTFAGGLAWAGGGWLVRSLKNAVTRKNNDEQPAIAQPQPQMFYPNGMYPQPPQQAPQQPMAPGYYPNGFPQPPAQGYTFNPQHYPPAPPPPLEGEDALPQFLRHIPNLQPTERGKKRGHGQPGGDQPPVWFSKAFKDFENKHNARMQSLEKKMDDLYEGDDEEDEED